MDAKTKAIVAHITIIGWIIAFISNGKEKDELTSFYIRQCLGIFIFFIISGFIPFLGRACWMLSFIMLIVSLFGALSGEMKPLPVIGEYFQQWFAGI